VKGGTGGHPNPITDLVFFSVGVNFKYWYFLSITRFNVQMLLFSMYDNYILKIWTLICS
jgi:hypothetical protein